jgi:HAD superfamily phosphatase (TIGR01668 family)
MGCERERRAGLVSFLCPRSWRPSVGHIDVRELKRRGIDGLIVDVDNTLVEWDRHEPTDALKSWFSAANDAGLRCCVVSNSRRRARIAGFAAALGVPFIAPAGKPLPWCFRSAMRVLGTDPRRTAVVGDQVFTDVLGGNALGLYTILVPPKCPREFVGTRLVRRLERLVLGYLRRRGYIEGA